MLNSLLKIEQYLECGICSMTINQAYLSSECGHRFCLTCIKKDTPCPTCQKPIRTLKKDMRLDRLVSYVNNLKTAFLSHTLTPLEFSLLEDQEPARKKLKVDKQALIGPKAILADMLPFDSQELEDNTMQEIEEDVSIFNESTEEWTCPKCQFPNPTCFQTCSICYTYRNTQLKAIKPPIKKQKERQDNNILTVAGENNTMENFTIIPEKIQVDCSKEAHILYTGLTPDDDIKLEKIKHEAAQSRLKIIIHYQTRDFDEITHIITSINQNRLCKRTLKYLQGILKGKWIVDPEWLIQSIESKQWKSETEFEVYGDQQSGITKAPSKSRQNQDKQLFQDMKFYFFGDFTGKHNKNDLLILCRSGGGKVLSRKPTGNRVDGFVRTEPVVIVSKETKKKPSWLNDCQIRDPSWIIDCISTLDIK